MKSESIKNIAKALSNFQGAMESVPKKADSVYKKKYANFESIIEYSKNLLLENELSISQLAYSEENKIGVETILMHVSGEWLSSKLAIPISGQNLAQACGAVISYAKRYGYSAILGIATGEDNDAQTQLTNQENITINNKQNETMRLMAKVGLIDPDASLYAQNEINRGVSIDQLINRLTDFNNDGYYWDSQSHQFLKKEL